MAVFSLTMVQLSLLFAGLVIIKEGVLACSGANLKIAFVDTEEYLINVSPFSVQLRCCLRCAIRTDTGHDFFTDPKDVSYFGPDGQPIVSGVNGITITDMGLQISDPIASVEDGDVFQCVFNNGTEHRNVEFHVIDLSPPTLSPNNGPVLDYVEGDNVALTCTGDREVSLSRYQWTLPDGTLEPDEPASQFLEGPLPLELRNVNRTDSGVYTCTGSATSRVTNEDVTVRSNITLNIQHPAKVLSFAPVMNNTILTMCSVLTLNCSFEGNPTPSVSWSHDGTLLNITANPALSQTITDNYALLEITFINYDLYGEYTCIVNNSIPTLDKIQVGNTKSYYVSYPFVITFSIHTSSSTQLPYTMVTSRTSHLFNIGPTSTVQSTDNIDCSNGDGLPVYGVALIVFLSLVSVTSITFNLILIVTLWFYMGNNKKSTDLGMKRSDSAIKRHRCGSDVPNSDIIVNLAYGITQNVEPKGNESLQCTTSADDVRNSSMIANLAYGITQSVEPEGNNSPYDQCSTSSVDDIPNNNMTTNLAYGITRSVEPEGGDSPYDQFSTSADDVPNSSMIANLAYGITAQIEMSQSLETKDKQQSTGQKRNSSEKSTASLGQTRYSTSMYELDVPDSYMVANSSYGIRESHSIDQIEQHNNYSKGRRAYTNEGSTPPAIRDHTLDTTDAALVDDNVSDTDITVNMAYGCTAAATIYSVIHSD